MYFFTNKVFNDIANIYSIKNEFTKFNNQMYTQKCIAQCCPNKPQNLNSC